MFEDFTMRKTSLLLALMLLAGCGQGITVDPALKREPITGQAPSKALPGVTPPEPKETGEAARIIKNLVRVRAELAKPEAERTMTPEMMRTAQEEGESLLRVARDAGLIPPASHTAPKAEVPSVPAPGGAPPGQAPSMTSPAPGGAMPAPGGAPAPGSAAPGESAPGEAAPGEAVSAPGSATPGEAAPGGTPAPGATPAAGKATRKPEDKPVAAGVEFHEYPGKPKWNELVRFHRRLVAEKATMTPGQIDAALREEERLMKEAKAETKGLQ
jgi:hypothetical protein